jgi:hypothetical protein
LIIPAFGSEHVPLTALTSQRAKNEKRRISALADLLRVACAMVVLRLLFG